MKDRDSLDAGNRTSYRLLGAGPALVFLHGLGCDLSIWSDVSYFFPNYTTIQYDLLGHGADRSLDKPQSLMDCVHQLDVLMKQLKIDSAVLVGHSLGGVVAALAVAERIDLDIRGLVLCGVPFDRQAIKLQAIRKRIAEIHKQGLAPFASTSVRRWFAPGYLDDKPDVEKAMVSMVLENKVESYLRAYELALQGDEALAKKARKVACPTLLLVGSEDLTASVEDTEKFAQILPQATVSVLKGVAHMSPIEAPEQVAQEIQDFLSSIS